MDIFRPLFSLGFSLLGGRLIGELDWSQWDSFLRDIKRHGAIRLHHVPVPAFPDGVEPSEEVKVEARRDFVKAWRAHMGEFDLGYKNFTFHIEDETGLKGTHEIFTRGGPNTSERSTRTFRSKPTPGERSRRTCSATWPR